MRTAIDNIDARVQYSPGRVSSRQRFRDYLAKTRDRRRTGAASPVGPGSWEQPRELARDSLQLVRAFVRLLRGQRTVLVSGLTALTLAMLLRLAPPAVIKVVVDHVLTDRPLPEWLRLLPWEVTRVHLLFLLGGAALCVASLTCGIRIWVDTVVTKAVIRLQTAMQKKAFEHAIRLPLHRVREIKSGGAVSLLRVDTESAAQLIRGLIFTPTQALVQIIGCFCVLVWIDWRLLLGMIALPLVYVTHRRWLGAMRPLNRDISAQRQRVDSMTVESLGGIQIVRTFGRERFETQRFVKEIQLNARQRFYVWARRRMIVFAWELALPAITLCLLLYGGYQVLHGRLTMGDVSMFLVFAAMLLAPLSSLVTTLSDIQANIASLDRLLDLLDEPIAVPQPKTRHMVNARQAIGHIELRNVCFRYPRTNHLVLKNINLEIQPGETVALVGRSGAGKTTLCNLIARFYDPTVGQILLDGRDLREIDVDSYRRLLAIVEQDVFLFDGTVRENIAYSRPQSPLERVVDAARAAGAHEFIEEMPQEYYTRIGERGAKLSGGQRQRLAIARALLADPRILILDEATSNLDSQSESWIRQHLQRLTCDRTCLIIAHRLSTIAFADRIIVVEDGRVVESGSHDRLMSSNSSYREMVALQCTVDQSARCG